jgi:hypothetical protein
MEQLKGKTKFQILIALCLHFDAIFANLTKTGCIPKFRLASRSVPENFLRGKHSCRRQDLTILLGDTNPWSASSSFSN